jgi:hypothetical protein
MQPTTSYECSITMEREENMGFLNANLLDVLWRDLGNISYFVVRF